MIFKNLRLSNFPKDSIVDRLEGLDRSSKSFGFHIERSLKYFNGIIFRNEGRSLVSYLLKFYGKLDGSITTSKVKAICIFSFFCYRCYKHEGSKGLVYYLKTSHVLIQQAVAGYRIEDMNPLKRRVRRCRSGFPLWIPSQYRVLLRNKDIGAIRF